MGQNEVKLIITTDGSGAITGVKGVTDSLGGLSNKVGSMTSMFKAHWLELSALTAGVYFSVKKIYNELAAAAERQEKRLAFTNLAASFGANADSIIADLKRMSGQSVTSFEIMSRAGRAMLSGLDPKAFPGLMEFSKTITKITGEDVGDTFSDLTRAIITGQDRMLRMQGITVDFDKAEKDLAASLGGTKEQLNAQMLKFARLTAIMEAAIPTTNRLGKEQRSLDDNLKAITTDISENATKIKDSWLLAFGPSAIGLLKAFNWELGQLNYLTNFGKAAYQKIKGLFSTPGEPMDFTVKGKGITSAKDLGFTFDTENQIGPGLQSLAAYTEELKDSLGELSEKEKDNTKEIAQQIKDREAAYHNMYEALKFDTEKYYTYQKGLLEKQRDEEIAVTDDIALAWEAFYARLEKLEEERTLRTNDFAGGIKVYYEELSREGFTWAQGAKDMMQDAASGASSSFQSFFRDIRSGSESAGNAFKNLGNNLLNSFSNAIDKMIADWMSFAMMTGIKALLGGVGGSFTPAAPGGPIMVHEGGYIPRFHSGGMSADEVPAILQRGEYVINRRAVAAVGRQSLDRINSGNAGSAGHIYNITIQNSFMDPTGIEKYNSMQKRQVEMSIKKLRKENKLR